ncbi:hypothetical protein TNCV_2868461 [Trichonephila clavipes]|nr:hypothetical protein TNCV_2868461 [Trichonephila clavipes]
MRDYTKANRAFRVIYKKETVFRKNSFPKWISLARGISGIDFLSMYTSSISLFELLRCVVLSWENSEHGRKKKEKHSKRQKRRKRVVKRRKAIKLLSNNIAQ